jgi:putative endonuclease
METYNTYILQSESTGRYYIGHTHDLDQRLKQHNDHAYSGSPATKRLQGPWKLVYSEKFATRSEAMNREKEFKSWKSGKAIERFILAQSDRVPTSRD